MNKKIKLIELLNKIVNGEDLPKRIKIQDLNLVKIMNIIIIMKM